MKNWIFGLCALVVVGLAFAAIISIQLSQGQPELRWGVCEGSLTIPDGRTVPYNCLWMSSIPEKLSTDGPFIRCKSPRLDQTTCETTADNSLLYVINCKERGVYMVKDEYAWREAVCPPSDER